MSEFITITLNGQVVSAQPGEMLIAVADRAGVHIPRFCYHPKLSVAANCRMCLVEVEGARTPLAACATPVMDGMQVWTTSPAATEAQKGTMEFLLINHPLDCPVCDQGGECELQDIALEYGKDVSRYSEARRAVRDPDLGPLVSTDMTRCIHCTRCVRFTEEIAGEQELGAFGRGEFTTIGTYIETTMHSELSGCVIDLCPVGALNARPSRMKARAWELETHAGLGEHDGVGSNLSWHTLRGEIIRAVPRQMDAVNQVWLSDRDRFSYQATAHPRRLKTPMMRHQGQWMEIDWPQAMQQVTQALQADGPSVGLVHPSSTVEECYLFQHLMRASGAQTVEHRLRASDFRGDRQYPLMPQLGGAFDDIAEADLIVLLGSYLRHDQPILGQRLRQTALAGTQVLAINPRAFDWNLPLQQSLIAMHDWYSLLHQANNLSKAPSAWSEAAKDLVNQLRQAKRARLWLGPLALNHPDASLLYREAARLCVRTDSELGVLPEGANAAGAWLVGCVAHRGPGGKALAGVALDACLEQPPAVWSLYGLDPSCDVDNPAALSQALAQARHVIGWQSFVPDDLEQTPFNLLLPIATVGEHSGHLISLEGRWQSMQAVVPAPGQARDGVDLLGQVMRAANIDCLHTSRAALIKYCQSLQHTSIKAESKDLGEQPRWVADGLHRSGAPSIYQQDPVTRHAHALQQTELARNLVLYLHPDMLPRYGLTEASELCLKQNGAAITLPLVLTEQVAPETVYLATGDGRLATLGSAFGPVELSNV